MKTLFNTLIAFIIVGCCISGCSSTSETTTTETTTIKAIVPEIHGTVTPIEDLVPIRSLPESTQTALIDEGFTQEDSVEVTTANTSTETGSVTATIYKPVQKERHKKPLAVLTAKPKSPIDATQTRSLKNEVKKSFLQSILDFVRSLRWFFGLLIIMLAVVMYLVKKYL